MQTHTLDAQTVALTGINLIEASAGTGKTWTISWLYLRLIVVDGLRTDQVLVVTYTEAATAELRDRIRKRLADALAYLEGRTSEEAYAALLAETERTLCIARLQLALVSFDEAAVFTIHGFCKRVLTENAFEACLPFESELVANEDPLLTELSDQFWYQHFLQPDALHLKLLQKYALTPDKLLAEVRHFIGKPYLREVIPTVTVEGFNEQHTAYHSALQACVATWNDEAQTIADLLLAGALNGSSYRKDYVQKWREALDTFFAVAPQTHAFPQETLQKFSSVQLQAKLKAGKQPPRHAFFTQVDALLAAHAALHATESGALESLRLQLLHHLRRELPIRKKQRGILTFDDLLLHVNRALLQHPQFAQRLGEKYQAALIDEFQDTDPIQYEIFAQMYREIAEPRVFFVGDPKQAIYGFRGADIHTYLQAAKRAQHQHTLVKNFRSHNALLQALNHLFAQSNNPFRSEIRYEPVEAGKAQAAIFLPNATATGAIPPLRLWEWADLTEHRASEVEDIIAEATADDIARLLNAGLQGQAVIGEQALRSSDIAVLVRTGRQGERIRQALLVRGIASVLKSRDSIFTTREASDLRAVLRAIAEPNNETALKHALVTELFSYSAAQLYALDEQPDLLERELEAFHAWHKQWHSHGFMAMFRSWLQQRDVFAYLLAFTDGERRLTNLLHLAELIHTESRLYGYGMHALIRWLQQRAAAAEEDETHQLRLESDADLVQIVTIHKSKGLEYAVVYCPYLWQEREAQPPTWFSCYDADTAQAYLQAKELATSKERQQWQEAEQAENLRLLYVALTRAKYHCTLALVSGNVSRFDYYSALGWLLFGDTANASDILSKQRKDGITAAARQAAMQARLAQMIASAEGRMACESLPQNPQPICYQPPVPVVKPAPVRTTLKLKAVPKVGSFSGLIAGKDDEKPDYDVFASPVPQVHEAIRTAFPRGAQAGSCLHKMLEELDFTQPVSTQRDTVVLPALARHGLAQTWADAAETLLDNTLHTPLTPVAAGFCLAHVAKSQRLDELEFYFPVAKLRVQALQRVLHDYLPAAWEEIHAAIDKLRFAELTGYMKGFIDLIFFAHGQYFIVDYKSNELGSHVTDYTFAAMEQAMAEHHYYLQYLIYCLALHRYLRQRLPDYAWETHVGGVLYLFLRGMQPNAADSGAFFHKPDYALIAALDRLML